MKDEKPINEETRSRRLPEPFERVWFALQRRVIWPLQDRSSRRRPGLGPHRPAPSRELLIGGGLAVVLAAVVAVVALSSGGGLSAPTVATEASAPREPLASTATPPRAEPKPKEEAPRETLHGAAPVFSRPSPASKGGEKSGKSKAVEAGAAADEANSSSSPSASASEGEAETDESGSDTSASPSPAAARISSDPKNSGTDKTAEGEATAARANVPDGPPAGPAALKVAREFAKGFVVYETGGEESAFRDAFEAAAAPELKKALLQRPPKLPAGVKVPRAKVLNVVAGPSHGKVYEVSVSLLRVGVTSELRLQMERTEAAGEHGKRVEWRVTNVLG